MKHLFTWIWLACAGFVSAQELSKYDLHPCGTAGYQDAWLHNYLKHPDVYNKMEDTILYVPITVHLVGSDDSSGLFLYSSLAKAFCRLNADYAASNIYFFMEGEPNIVASTFYNNHETVLDGYQMMLENDVPNTVNSYFVANPAGNCGYNLPYASVAVGKACAGPNDHTWAHEIGHNLRLPHPFLGWEGNSYTAGSPAPDTIVTDAYTFFQLVPVLNPDTIIYDTMLVALLDYSNCEPAADHFCDTKADYLSYRWPCNADNESTVQQLDPTGAPFRSDGTLFMSYSYDECQSRFSDEQIAAMRNNLQTEKAGYLYNQSPPTALSDVPTTPLLPAYDAETAHDFIGLRWTSVPGATHYIIQLGLTSSFSLMAGEYWATDTTFILTDLLPNKTYYWRVQAVNNYVWCSDFCEKTRFKTTDALSPTTNTTGESWRVFPSPARAGQPLLIELPAPDADLRITLTDALGRQIAQYAATATTLSIPTDGLAGYYTVALWRQGRIVGTSRLMVMP